MDQDDPSQRELSWQLIQVQLKLWHLELKAISIVLQDW